MLVADSEGWVPEIKVWILILVQKCLFCPVLLYCLLSFGLCPGKWDPLAQENCRDLSYTQFPAVLLPCRNLSLEGSFSAVAQLHFPGDVKVIPGVEPSGKIEMEIKVPVLAALRDVSH